MAKHSLDFWLTSEDLPDPNNRVTLDRNGKIVLTYTPNNLEAHERLQAKLKQAMKQTNCCNARPRVPPGTVLRETCTSGSAFRWPAWRIRTARFASDTIRRPRRWT